MKEVAVFTYIKNKKTELSSPEKFKYKCKSKEEEERVDLFLSQIDEGNPQVRYENGMFTRYIEIGMNNVSYWLRLKGTSLTLESQLYKDIKIEFKVPIKYFNKLLAAYNEYELLRKRQDIIKTLIRKK